MQSAAPEERPAPTPDPGDYLSARVTINYLMPAVERLHADVVAGHAERDVVELYETSKAEYLHLRQIILDWYEINNWPADPFFSAVLEFQP